MRSTGDIESYLHSVFKLNCIHMKRLELTLNSVFYEKVLCNNVIYTFVCVCIHVKVLSKNEILILCKCL